MSGSPQNCRITETTCLVTECSAIHAGCRPGPEDGGSGRLASVSSPTTTSLNTDSANPGSPTHADGSRDGMTISLAVSPQNALMMNSRMTSDRPHHDVSAPRQDWHTRRLVPVSLSFARRPVVAPGLAKTSWLTANGVASQPDNLERRAVVRACQVTGLLSGSGAGVARKAVPLGAGVGLGYEVALRSPRLVLSW